MPTTLALSSILLLGFSLCQAQAADASLVLSLSFDDGGGEIAADLSDHGNDGELKGDPEWVEGRHGKALKFDGVDDWVEVPHADILTVDEEVTVMAWINAERHTGPGGAQWQGILAKSNGPRSYSLYTESGQALHFSTAGSGSLSTGKVPLNQWVHVAAMVVDGKHKYYIDAQPAGEGGGGISLPGAADTAAVVVAKTHEGSREFQGMIDEVRIWNRALTDEEIEEQMNMGAGSTAVTPMDKAATKWAQVKMQ
jgi:hypothetical protein